MLSKASSQDGEEEAEAEGQDGQDGQDGDGEEGGAKDMAALAGASAVEKPS